MRNILVFAIIFLGRNILAQPPSPGTLSGKVFIKGGTYHIGNGKVIENGYLIFDQGKILSVGKLSNFQGDTLNANVVIADKKHIYPGFILMNTGLGLVEVPAVRATQDKYEVGSINPNSRAVIAYNAESELIYANRMNGILSAQIVPRGGLISGQSSLVQLDAWNWEDAILKSDEGIHVNWPSKYGSGESPDQKNAFKEAVKKQCSELEQLFLDAKSYSMSSESVFNSKLAPLAGLFSGEKRVYVHANYGSDIWDGVTFFKNLGVKKISVVGAYESYAVTGFLRENKIPVVLNKIHQLPLNDDEDISLPFKLPKILSDSGVVFALAYEGEEQNSRNLPFLAGTAMAYGLDPEKALASITSIPAQILGVDNSQGTLEVGKMATLFISKGNALDIRGNILLNAYVQGREIVLDNKQFALFRKFASKYGIK